MHYRLLPFYQPRFHEPQGGHRVDETRGRLLCRDPLGEWHALGCRQAAMSGIHLATKHADPLPYECLRGIAITRGNHPTTPLIPNSHPVADSRRHRAHRGGGYI